MHYLVYKKVMKKNFGRRVSNGKFWVGDESRLAEQELGGVERRGVAESTELRPARPSAVLVLLVEAEEEVVIGVGRKKGL